MRRFQIIAIVLSLVTMFVGCAQLEKTDEMNENIPSVERVGDQLFFSSIDELLGSYIVAKESRTGGGEIESLVSKWTATYSESDLADVANSINFTSLEKLYLPTGIPEDYQLCRIGVTKDGVNFWYLHKNDMVSEDAIQDALLSFRHYLFIVTRWDMDTSFLIDAMLNQNNAVKETLIDGKYLFHEPHSLDWVYERERFVLYMPLQQNAYGKIGIGSEITVEDMIRYAETGVVDLLDRNEVMSRIGEEVQNQVEEILAANKITE